METIKQFALAGLRDIARKHKTDPAYKMMKRGYEYIRDHPEKFALIDLGNGETRLMSSGDSLTLFDPAEIKPERRFEP